MSDEKKKSAEAESAFPNPLKMFGEMYNQAMQQAAEQWEETARNPLFLAAMANNVEQTMQMQKQMQEMISASLEALNLPTKDDFLLLVERIAQLSSNIAEINAKLDKLAKQNKTRTAKSQPRSGKTKS